MKIKDSVEMLFGFRKKIFQWDTKGNLNHIEAWEDFLGRAARGISMDLYKNRLNKYAVVMFSVYFVR